MSRRTLNRYGRACLRALEKRRNHLRQRIASSPVDLSYDRAEASALDWALDFIRAADLRESATHRLRETDGNAETE